ncbi:hypothetical protein G5B30_12170 [Sphingobacterium sp. SGG-5]|uniref:hypothetical protein n=1 Tax=Sphingobacterium sp. SGG-5 TaxID=2710881 RepID=UPI0013ED8491|nr:hypothetical protein [Sphingobacterium sp. SGG-5]NGM62671.1 hypothetical protein [Sphingobacterium sp. SGG-5]
MEKWFDKQLAILTAIYDALIKFRQQHNRMIKPLQERKLWTKQDVLDRLNMSERTYKRNLQTGLLKPMRLNGFDEYFEEDLLEALEESRRKGRI